MRALFLIVLVCVAAAPVKAQSPVPQVRLKTDTTLNLGELHRAAEASDPRARELDLLRQQGALRDRNIDVLRLPSIGVETQAQYQTDVVSSPIVSPTGTPL